MVTLFATFCIYTCVYCIAASMTSSAYRCFSRSCSRCQQRCTVSLHTPIVTSTTCGSPSYSSSMYTAKTYAEPFDEVVLHPVGSSNMQARRRASTTSSTSLLMILNNDVGSTFSTFIEHGEVHWTKNGEDTSRGQHVILRMREYFNISLLLMNNIRCKL